MKKSNSFTFDLIKSLSPPEKAYIKKKISSSGKHLSQLFDDLNKFEIYIKEAFILKNKNKLYIKNLSQNKNYLHKKIIEELINFHSKSIFEINIHNQINEAIILIEKKFYKRAKKIIDACFEKATYVEDYATCYILTGIIFKAINNKIYFGLTDEEIKWYKSNRYIYLSQLNKLHAFAELNDTIYSVDGPIKQLETYNKIFRNLNVSDKSDLPQEYPFITKQIFYFSKAKAALLSGDKCDYVRFNKKIVELYIKNDQFIQYHFTSFLQGILNFLNSLLQIYDYKTFFLEHQKITDLIKPHLNKSYCIGNGLIYVINYLFPQIAFNMSNYYKKALHFTESFTHFINENYQQLSDYYKAVSFIEISIAYLNNNKYTEALEKLNTSLDLKNYQTQYYSKLIQILAHYGLKNDLLLDHLFQSFFNYLKSANKKEQISNIRKLKKHIKNNTVHLLKNEDFEDFVYIHWDLFELT